jgi:Putative beta-barrel porin-2, OmpL-like. bbp2
MTMRSRWAAALSAFAMMAPSFASANDADVERQLQQMQQRMQQMEDKLQATSDQLDSANARVDEQSQVIEQAGLAETRGSSNGLPGFLGEITIGGSVAASYLYNLNDPNDADLGGLGNTNSGLNNAFYPLHPDHNSFALDAVWFEVEREVNEEHRGGFRFDTVYGKTGALLNVGGPNNRDARDDSAFYIHQGYVQYLAPVLDGVKFKFGKFEDLFGVGTESANNAYSWNITRGNVWTLLEPIDHIGILAGVGIGDTGLNFQVGGVNGFRPDDPDRNDAKSVTGRIGWDSDNLHASVAGIWGGEFTAFDGHETGTVNGTVRVDATDRLAFYVNGDYAWLQESDAAAWGIAAAGRFGITERTGIALRGEYVADVDGFLGFGGLTPFDTCCQLTGIEVWGVTATIDHMLTDHLMIRGEVRYDNINKDDTDNDEFFEDSSNNGLSLEEDQIVLGVEAVYNFNKFGGE